MKKWLVVLFAAAAMTAWAQDEEGEEGDSSSWKITGSVKSGFEAAIKKGGNTLSPYNDGADRAFQASVQLDKTGENSGVSILLRAEGFPDAKPGNPESLLAYLPLGHAYGWVGFLGNKIELSGGLLDNAKWGTFSTDLFNTSLDNRNTLKIEIKPIEGLSFGANLFRPDGDGTKLDPDLEHGINKPVFGVKYEKTDVFGVAAEFVIKSTAYNGLWMTNTASFTKELVGEATPVYTLDARPETKFGTLFSAYFAGVDNKLRVDLDGAFALLETFSAKIQGDTTTLEDLSLVGVSALATFKVSDLLAPGIQVDFGRAGTTVSGQSLNIMDIVITPQVAVTLNPVIAFGLAAGINLADMRSGDMFSDWTNGFGFNVKPSATFTITPNTSIVLFYNFVNLKAGYGSGGSAKTDAVTTHTIQLDLNWTF